MVKVKFDAEVEEMPLAVANKFGLFVNRKNVTAGVRELYFWERKNEIPYLQATINKRYADSTDFERGKYAALVFDDEHISTGVITKPEKDSFGNVKIYAPMVGKEGVDLMNSLVGRESYINEYAGDVVGKLCSENLDGSAPWIIQKDTVEDIEKVTVRAENENRLNVIQRIAKELKDVYWRVSFPLISGDKPQWREECRMNLYDYGSLTSHPEKNYPKYDTLNSTNCKSIKYTIDEEKTTNYVRLLGSGDGTNQLESIIYHATDNRTYLTHGTGTWLSSDIDDDDTTLNATSNPRDIWPASPTTTTTSNNETAGTSVQVEVADSSNFAVGDFVMFDDTTNREVAEVTVVHDTPDYITVDKLTEDFSSGTTVRKCQVQVDGEYMAYTSRDATTLTVKRDNVGNATSHPAGTDIMQVGSGQTIYVDDNSSLPATGSVWVGLEKISYTGKSGTTGLTGCSRGQGWLGTNTPSTKLYYAHGAGVAAWDSQYTPSSPEAGSSIDTYGTKAGLQTDQTLISQNALDLAATTILDELYVPPSQVEVIPIENAMIKEIDLGDTIAIEDSARSGASGNFRVNERSVEKKAGGQTVVKFTAGKILDSVSDQIGRIQKDFGNVSVYAQGTPQTITINSAENCEGDNSTWNPADEADEDTNGLYPLKMEFYIPANAISISKVYLDYFVERYRDFDVTLGSNSSSGGSGGGAIFNWSENVSDSAWDTVGNQQGSATGFYVCYCSVQSTDTSSSVTGVSCRVTDGTTYWPDQYGMEAPINEEDADGRRGADFCIMVPSSSSSKTLSCQLLATDDDFDGEGHVKWYKINAHTHDATSTISTTAADFDDMKIAIDQGHGYVDKTSIIENAQHLNRALSTSREKSIDLTEFFGDTPGKKGIKILGCRSDAGDAYIGRIFGILRVKYYESND